MRRETIATARTPGSLLPRLRRVGDPEGPRWNIVDYFALQPALCGEAGVPDPRLVFCAAWQMDVRGIAWGKEQGFDRVYS